MSKSETKKKMARLQIAVVVESGVTPVIGWGSTGIKFAALIDRGQVGEVLCETERFAWVLFSPPIEEGFPFIAQANKDWIETWIEK